jgi:hypothetical protein
VTGKSTAQRLNLRVPQGNHGKETSVALEFANDVSVALYIKCVINHLL